MAEFITCQDPDCQSAGRRHAHPAEGGSADYWLRVLNAKLAEVKVLQGQINHAATQLVAARARRS